MTERIIHGDCLEVMRAMDADSIDATITDPPYELGFMGKAWDRGGIAFRVELWEAALRVAKPGSYLLAFGGTRTYHRMTCAIEDAGWEIRDTICWLYGQGYPKSQNVNKDSRFCQCGALPYSHAPNDNVRRVWPGVSGLAEDSAARQESDVLAPMQREVAGRGVEEARTQGTNGTHAGELLPGGDARAEESGMEGRRDDIPQARELLGSEILPSAGVGATNGEGGRLRDDASADDGADVQSSAHANGSGASSRPRPEKQRAKQSRTVARQPEPQSRRAWPHCHGCGKPIVPAGLGSALKPAYEPIVVARKPLAGTIAHNVELYGTGALNIDACRLATDEPIAAHHGTANPRTAMRDGWHDPYAPGDAGKITQTAGRWPANVCCDEEAARLIDEASGERKAGVAVRHRSGGKTFGTDTAKPPMDDMGYGDTGGASRFFYCAKASRSEREAGLESQEHRRRADVASMNAHNHEGGIDGRGKPYKIAPVKNNHPTVKPVALMRWLVRFVTPIGGTVLDPFAGSGTTGIAAVQEDRSFIGIENDDEYLPITDARIRHVADQGSLFRPVE